MRIVVRPAAAADVDDAYLWYEQQRSGLGEEFLTAVDFAKTRIATVPEQFAIIHRDTRRVLLQRFPYALYYRIYGDVVLVIACMHGRRDPKRWMSR